LASRCNGLSLGEIRYSSSHIENGKRKCSCEESFENCVYWSPIINIGVVNKISSMQYLSVYASLKLLFDKKSRNSVLRFYEELFNHSNSRQVLIDSSKTAPGAFLRPFIVKRILKNRINVHFVGVYRHPAGVYSSLNKGSNEEMIAGKKFAVEGRNIELKNASYKILLSWSYANIAMILNHILYLFSGGNSQIHSIERLSKNPDLLNVNNIVDVNTTDATEPKTANAHKNINHIMGGNRLTKNTKFEKPILSSNVVSEKRISKTYIILTLLLFPILALLFLFRK